MTRIMLFMVLPMGKDPRVCEMKRSSGVHEVSTCEVKTSCLLLVEDVPPLKSD